MYGNRDAGPEAEQIASEGHGTSADEAAFEFSMESGTSAKVCQQLISAFAACCEAVSLTACSSQEAVALRRRLARLQRDMNRQTAVLEAAESNRSLLQSVACELTADTERLGSVQGCLRNRLASAVAARSVAEVCFPRACCVIARGRRSQELPLCTVQSQARTQAEGMQDLSAANSRLEEQLSVLTEQLEEAAMSNGAMQVRSVGTASVQQRCSSSMCCR